MNIEDHPEYGTAHTEYVTQLAQAQAARDETAEAKAENAWLKRQMSMSQELVSKESAKAAHAAAIAKIKAEHPQIPEGAYSHIPDIKAMEAVVKEIAPNYPAPTATPPANDPQGGFVPPSGDPKSSKRAGSPFDDPTQARDIAARARKGDRQAQEDIRKRVFQTQIAPSMAKYGPAREAGMKKAGY